MNGVATYAGNSLRVRLIWIPLCILLMWPALLNRGPILFYDSMAYLNAPAAAVEAVTGERPEVFGPDPLDPSSAPGWAGGGAGTAPGPAETAPAADPAAQSETEQEDKAILAGRSIYYGMLFFLALQIGGFWAMPLVQSALFAIALSVFLRAQFKLGAGGILAVGAVVAILSAAPFFTSYMMPDFLAGLLVLAVIRLLAPPWAGWPERLFWMLLLVLAAACHSSHLAVGLGLLLTAPLALALTGLPVSRIGAGLTALALALAVLAEVAFGLAVERIYGTPPLRPPFLAARMIADGPGLTHLQQVCTGLTAPESAAGEQPPRPAQPYEYCRYMDRLDQDADTILWSGDPAKGVYAPATTASKTLMSRQQFAFARDVLANYPAAQLTASATRFGEQLSQFSLGEFPYTPPVREYLDWVLSGPREAALHGTRFYQDRFPLALPDLVIRVTVVASALFLVIAGLAGLRHRPETYAPRPQRQSRLWAGLPAGVVLVVAVALLGYGATTGILATPHDRYQARVYWLLPMLAAVALWKKMGPAPR